MSYGITADKIVFVSDRGLNIKTARRTYHWVLYSAHTLNMVLRHKFSERNAPEGFKDVLEIIDK